jgi:hypothetical protein
MVWKVLKWCPWDLGTIATIEGGAGGGPWPTHERVWKKEIGHYWEYIYKARHFFRSLTLKAEMGLLLPLNHAYYFPCVLLSVWLLPAYYYVLKLEREGKRKRALASEPVRAWLSNPFECLYPPRPKPLSHNYRISSELTWKLRLFSRFQSFKVLVRSTWSYLVFSIHGSRIVSKFWACSLILFTHVLVLMFGLRSISFHAPLKYRCAFWEG